MAGSLSVAHPQWRSLAGAQPCVGISTELARVIRCKPGWIGSKAGHIQGAAWREPCWEEGSRLVTTWPRSQADTCVVGTAAGLSPPVSVWASFPQTGGLGSGTQWFNYDTFQIGLCILDIEEKLRQLLLKRANLKLKTGLISCLSTILVSRYY